MPGAPVCVKNCNPAGFFTFNSFPCVSRMVHNPKDIQATSHNCGKHWNQLGPVSLWNVPKHLDCCEGKSRWCNSILGRCSSFFVNSVYISIKQNLHFKVIRVLHRQLVLVNVMEGKSYIEHMQCQNESSQLFTVHS